MFLISIFDCFIHITEQKIFALRINKNKQRYNYKNTIMSGKYSISKQHNDWNQYSGTGKGVSNQLNLPRNILFGTTFSDCSKPPWKK